MLDIERYVIFDDNDNQRLIHDLSSIVELNENYETSLSPFNHIFEGKMRHYKAKRKYGTIS
jgi:hypothetical protein